MNHDARIIPLDRRSAPAAGLRQWAGLSRRRREGDTLVVTTTNFTTRPRALLRASRQRSTAATLTLTERLRRVDHSTLICEFTVNDPATFTRPFTAAVPMQQSDRRSSMRLPRRNYGLMSIMRGARMLEAEQTKGDDPAYNRGVRRLGRLRRNRSTRPQASSSGIMIVAA